MNKLLGITALLAASSASFAANIVLSQNPINVPSGGNVTVELRAQGDASSIGVSGRFNFVNPPITATAAPFAAAGTVACNVIGNQVLFSFLNAGNAIIPNAVGTAGVRFCDVTFATPAATPASMNNAITFPPANMTCADAMGNKILPCTGTSNNINVVVATSTYTAAPATLTFNAVPNGTTSAAQNVTVTNTSAANPVPPTLTISSCTFGGANPGSFARTATPVLPVNVALGASQVLGVQCVAPAGAAPTVQTATLTCVTNATGSPVNFVTGLTCNTIAEAPPAIAYNPTPTTTVNLTGASTLTGQTATANIVATPSGGNGAGANNTTLVNTCAITGAGAAAFGAVAGINLSFVGNTTMAQNIPLSCVRVFNVAQNASLTCQERRGVAAAVAQTWPVVCPAGTGAAQIAAVPVSGSVLPVIQAAVGTSATNTPNNSLVLSNPGQLVTDVTCTAPGAPFFAAPLAFTLAPGGSQSITITYTPDTQGTNNGVLTCTATGLGLAATTLTFNLRGFAISTIAVPTMSEFGRWMLLGLVAGLGAFVAFRKR